ncbi:MAG: putative Ig domain-containing protein, partial [Chloroflexota bacterium]
TTGAITGTPPTAGTFPFTVTVTDSLGATGVQPYSVTINPAITVTPATLPNGTVGVAYNQTISATGGSGTYSNFAVTTGSLPAPLTLDATTGAITGTPPTAGTFPFTVTVTDSLGATGVQPYNLTIDPTAIVVTPPTLPGGSVGVVYNQTISATGGSGSYTNFAVTAGSLPPPLNLDPITGALTGTPTTAGTFPFTVTVTDSLGATGVQPYSVTINSAITVTPATLPNGMIGIPYNQTIGATGGSGTYNNFAISAGSLPPPLTLDPTTGAITGTPTTIGTFPFSVTVTDSLGATGVQPYSVTIDPAALALQPTVTTLPNATQGTPYPFNFSATGGTPGYTFASTTLPAVLSLATNGALSGTPTATGTFTFDVTVTDSAAATDTKTYTLTVDPTPVLSLQPLAGAITSGTQNVAYTFSFTALGGTPGYTFTTPGPLPAGVTLATDGTLSGTPTASGTFTFSVTVADSTLPTALTDSKTYSLTINPTGTITLGALPNGAINVPYSATITVTPTNTYTFAVTSGTLPTGLTLSTAGVLSGTPTTTSSFTFTVQATSGAGSGTKTYTIIISQPIYVSSPGPSSTINVGTVQIGTAISANLVISNNGLSPATLAVTRSGALITGLNAADFALTNLPSPFNGLSIPGKVGSTVSSQTITIRCIPSANGLRIATLTFTTNDPTKPTVTYALACTGSGTAVPTATPAGFLATATAFVIPPTEVLPATGSVVEVKGLAMRTGPYLGATLIGKAIPGAPYSILARSNDEGGGITWYLITTVDGVTGWVSGLYLNVTGNVDAVPFQGSIFDTLDGAPDTGISARAMSIIDIRRRPSGRAAIIGQVPQDGTLHLMGRTRQNGGDFWVQVNYNGIIGWIPAAPISVRGNTGTVPIR